MLRQGLEETTASAASPVAINLSVECQSAHEPAGRARYDVDRCRFFPSQSGDLRNPRRSPGATTLNRLTSRPIASQSWSSRGLVLRVTRTLQSRPNCTCLMLIGGRKVPRSDPSPHSRAGAYRSIEPTDASIVPTTVVICPRTTGGDTQLPVDSSTAD
ncbi:hypothetical protein VTO42DRAFT_1813 [Malbranchea cinnamomea]